MKVKHVHSHCVKSAQIRSFFWSVFSRIRTEYREILCISPYSVRMRKIRLVKNSVFGHFSLSVSIANMMQQILLKDNLPFLI